MSSLWLLLGCGAAPEPTPVAVELVQPEPLPEVPRSVHRTRSLRLEAAWGGGVPPCEPPCSVAPVKGVEASTERGRNVGALATDGDLSTSWCGYRGRRDQILVRFDQPFDVSAVVVHARGVAKLSLTSSEWDEASLALGPAVEGEDPPWAELGFAGADLVNVEIADLHPGGSGCIEEIAFVGTPTVP